MVSIDFYTTDLFKWENVVIIIISIGHKNDINYLTIMSSNEISPNQELCGTGMCMATWFTDTHTF